MGGNVYDYAVGIRGLVVVDGAVSVLANKPLVPTRNGEAPLLAAQRGR